MQSGDRSSHRKHGSGQERGHGEDLSSLSFDGGDELLRGDIDPEVDDLKPAAFKERGHEILADVVQIPFHRSNNDSTERLRAPGGQQGADEFHARLHGPSRKKQFGHKVFAPFEAGSDLVHGRRHEFIDELERVQALGQGFLRQGASHFVLARDDGFVQTRWTRQWTGRLAGGSSCMVVGRQHINRINPELFALRLFCWIHHQNWPEKALHPHQRPQERDLGWIGKRLALWHFLGMTLSKRGGICWSRWGVRTVFALIFTAGALFAAEDLGEAPGKTAQQIMDASRDAVVVIRQIGRDGAREGLGTGFVISRDGLVATSLHVIGEARPLTVSFANGKSAKVTEIHAWDRKLDLAVIRVEGTDLPKLRLGDSDNLKQGAPVVAIGNPQGLTHSIVQGVVSAVRDFEFGPMIQLAIPIEPGNSGGPLLDMKGRVQGILDMKSAVTENLGFATPINALKPLLDHPNTVPLERWLAFGALNESLWKPVMGAQWRQKAGMITVDGAGEGFGGRSLCLSQKEVPEGPYELAVSVRLDDESGAAGLAFASDGGDRHYGFYPSAGQLRLTRFDGPTVFTWTILRQIDAASYHPGEWNRIKVRVDPQHISCFVNGQMVTEIDEGPGERGKAGLAKFRNTSAQFRNFQIGRSVDSDIKQNGDAAGSEDQIKSRLAKLVDRAGGTDLEDAALQDAAASRTRLLGMAREWDQKAAGARKLARDLNEKAVERELLRALEPEEARVDLFSAAFLIGRIENPELEVSAYREELENMAQEVRKGWPGSAPSNRAKLESLRKYLFEESGFHGSRSDYYNRANSFMNRVLEDREGIPITLSVLFLELGNRLGIEKLQGMPFPGHFMVRFLDGDQEALYVDVFDGGKIYKRSELYALIATRSEVPLLDEHFKPAAKRDIIVRMLKNLAGAASGTASLPYLDLLLAVSPNDALEHWRRASLRLQAGERSRARDDLQWLLEKRPAGFDLERVDELYQSLR